MCLTKMEKQKQERQVKTEWRRQNLKSILIYCSHISIVVFNILYYCFNFTFHISHFDQIFTKHSKVSLYLL